jgi:predicted dithiol-disulfide oxidoreductase (DUF899 family)
VFEGPEGKSTLADLFQGRSAVYHFMLTPGSDHVCKGCSFVADHIDAARQHFGDADLSFAAISRASLERIEHVKRVLGWTFPWVSSYSSDFNFDFGVSFKKEDIAAGRATFNYGTPIKSSEDMMGTSIFARNESGEVFHTYSTFARGIENLMGAFMWLDLTPKGRHESDDHRSRLSEDGLRDARKAGRSDDLEHDHAERNVQACESCDQTKTKTMFSLHSQAENGPGTGRR